MSESTRARSFFVLCCARSGSTSLARILDLGSNGCCAVEPGPDLNVESRLAMDERLVDTASVVRNIIVPRVESALERHDVYGEKHVTYGPFVRDLHEQLGARFIHLRRDGRDVVASMINWHEQLFGNVYRECNEAGNLAPAAVSAASALPCWKDTSDFARPRPRSGDGHYARWEQYTRLEMCAYYWSFINNLHLEALSTIPRDSWIELDYTTANAEDLLETAAFCGVEGLDRDAVQAHLDAKINSLKERGAQSGRLHRWTNWTSGERAAFDDIAAAMMERLGYYGERATRWRPRDYGRWWDQHEGGIEWYEWMYDTRRRMHEEFVEWIRSTITSGEPIDSVADFGCGVGVGYCDALADLRYVGIDLGRGNIEWCRANRGQPRHQYFRLDFICEPLPEPCDVVMSSGTIDNVYDVEALLRSMVQSARRWIYLTAYRGWFPDLREHRYRWSDEHQCFYTDVSPGRLELSLLELGCRDVTVEPRRTARTDIPYETRVIARVPEC